jgi:PAS domain-containing protein
MGRVAAQRSSAPPSRLRVCAAACHRFEGVPVVVTYHPAHLLRHPQDKAAAWEDLCLALEVRARCRFAHSRFELASDSRRATMIGGAPDHRQLALLMAAVPAPKASVATTWDVLPGPVLLVGTDGIARAANADFCAFFGIDPKALEAAGWDKRFSETSRTALRAALAAPSRFHPAARRDCGRRSSLLARMRRALGRGRRGYVCLLHDITAGTRAQSVGHRRRPGCFACSPTTFRC